MKNHYFLFLLVGICLLIYTYKLDLLPYTFHTDEGETALQVLRIKNREAGLIGVGWGDLPLLSFVPQVITVSLFGQNIVGSRIALVIFALAGLISFYFLLNLFFKSRVAFLATIFLATSHMYIAFARLGMANMQAVFLVVTAFYFIFRGFLKDSIVSSILGGVFLALCFYSYSGARMALIVIPFAFLINFSNRKLKRKLIHLLIAAASFILIFLPQGKFYIEHPQTFWSRARYVYIFSEAGRSWTAPEYAEKNNLEIFLSQFKKGLNVFAGDSSTQYGYGGPLLDFISLLLVGLGLFYMARRQQWILVFFVSWFLTVFIFGQVLTTIPSPIFLPRLMVGLPVIFIFAACGLEFLYQKLIKHRLLSWLLVFVILFFVSFYNLNVYFVKYPKEKSRDWGAKTATELARYINSLDDSYKPIFLTLPYFDGDFSSLRFLTSQKEGVNIRDPRFYQGFEKTRLTSTAEVDNEVDYGISSRSLVYIIEPHYKIKLDELVVKHSYGVIEGLKNTEGEIQFYVFKVK